MVRSILWYTRAVNLTVLITLSTIATEQVQATNTTINNVNQLLDYLVRNNNSMMRYYALDMILNIHSDVSYLSERKSKSRASGHFLLVGIPCDGTHINLNGSVYTLCTIFKFMESSAAKGELSDIFIDMKHVCIILHTLFELGDPESPTPINCDNATASGIENGTIKK